MRPSAPVAAYANDQGSVRVPSMLAPSAPAGATTHVPAGTMKGGVGPKSLTTRRRRSLSPPTIELFAFGLIAGTFSGKVTLLPTSGGKYYRGWRSRGFSGFRERVP